MELNERQEEQEQEQEEDEEDDEGQNNKIQVHVQVEVQEEEGVDIMSPSSSEAAAAVTSSSTTTQPATTTTTGTAQSFSAPPPTTTTTPSAAEVDLHRAEVLLGKGSFNLIQTNTNTIIVDDCEVEVSAEGGCRGDVDVDVDDDTSPSLSLPTINPENFINNGFQYWQEARNEWCGNITTDGSTSAGDVSLPRHAIDVDVDEIIDVLFDPRWRGVPVVRSPSGNTNPTSPSSVSTTQTQQSVAAEIIASQPPRFPQNVPLPQMIDVLVDLWEAEGLDV